MHISHANVFIKHSWKINDDLCFIPNFIQIIIEVVTLGYGPNIHMELHYNLFKNSFNPSLRMMVWKGAFWYLPLSKHVATRTPFKSKITCNGVTSHEGKRGIGECTPKVEGISCTFVHQGLWIWQLHFFHHLKKRRNNYLRK